MKLIRLLTAFTLACVLSAQSFAVLAADEVFGSKTIQQHELTDWEKKKMDAEFTSQFGAADDSAFQKLNSNPWAGKKERQDQHAAKMLQLSDTWGSCREYAYKQRGQCYGRGGDAYTCERYYDARVQVCNEKF